MQQLVEKENAKTRNKTWDIVIFSALFTRMLLGFMVCRLYSTARCFIALESG